MKICFGPLVLSPLTCYLKRHHKNPVRLHLFSNKCNTNTTTYMKTTAYQRFFEKTDKLKKQKVRLDYKNTNELDNSLSLKFNLYCRFKLVTNSIIKTYSPLTESKTIKKAKS